MLLSKLWCAIDCKTHSEFIDVVVCVLESKNYGNQRVKPKSLANRSIQWPGTADTHSLEEAGKAEADR